MDSLIKRFYLLVGCLLLATAVTAQHTVHGVVLLDDNETAIGANVIEKGNPTNGTLTNIDGKFTLTVSSPSAYLTISYIGFQAQEVAVNGKTNLTITLKEDSKELDEVVIVGFGVQKKINATGAVKTIDDASLKDRPTANAVESLQGVIAGLNISSDAGGAPGSTKNINIRGIGNLGEDSNSSPLILIDGMEGDINTLNPADIENISVLKDAASASIYGSRAPFGVILITTKNGTGAQKRPVSVNYSANVRIQQPVSIPNTVDGLTYAYMLNDAYRNSGGTPPFSNEHIGKIQAFQSGKSKESMGYYENLDTWYKNQAGYGNTNWYDVYVKSHTVSHEHNASVSGSTKKIDYRVSGNFMSQTGLFNYADEVYRRFNIAGKITYNVNKYLTLGWSTRFASDCNKKPSVMDDLFFHNLGRTSPVIPLVNPYNGEYHEDSMMQPILEGGRINSKTKKLYNQLNVIVEPIKDWKIHAEINSRIERNPYTRTFNPMTYHMPSGREEYLTAFRDITANEHNVKASTGTIDVSPAGGESYLEEARSKVNYFETNVYTDYNLKLKSGHNFTFLLGEQSEYYKIETDRHANYDYPIRDGQVYKHLETNIQGEWSSLGFFARANYDYKYRYLAEVNFRADGASRFPKNQRWGYFPSFSAGWNISEEPFMAHIKDKFLDNLKLRASYGTLGNQNTTSFYPYYQAMYVNTTSLVLGGQQQSSLPVYTPYSTSLTWETIVNKDLGVDFTLFGNRLTGSFDWYQRTTKDMIGPALSLSALYGAPAPRTNNAELRTRGWEVELTWRDHIGKFNYSVTANLSDYKSVITKYYSPTNQCFGESANVRNGSYWYEGKVLGEIWGYHVVGVAKSDDEMNNYLNNVSQSSIGSNWGGGDLMYADLNGDGKVDAGSATLNDHGDMKRIGNSTPHYAFSLTLQGDYKWFDFRIYLQGVGKRDFLFENCAPFYGMAGEWQRNFYTDHLDYFRYAGSELGANLDDPYYGRIRIDRNNIQASDRYLQNAAYVRLKNLQIGFSLPKGTRLEKYVKSARLYFSVENLLTFTKLRIFDPEGIDNGGGYGAGKVYPNYRTYSIGLNATF